MPQRPERKVLPHDVPSWVPDGADYFITINALARGTDTLTAHADALWATLLFQADRGILWPRLFLVMPDHVHGIFVFSRMSGIQPTISNWKRYTARAQGIQWQRDFFEHRLRSDESFDEKAAYIRMNPVRKGLVALPEEWPFVWSLART